MNDTVYRQDVLSICEKRVWNGADDYYPISADVIAVEVKALPPAQSEYKVVTQKKGKWIPHHDEVMLFNGMSMGGMACSVCGWKTHNKMHLIFGCPYKYCPDCGAQMGKKEHYTMEEFMYGQDLGNPEDGSL